MDTLYNYIKNNNHKTIKINDIKNIYTDKQKNIILNSHNPLTLYITCYKKLKWKIVNELTTDDNIYLETDTALSLYLEHHKHLSIKIIELIKGDIDNELHHQYPYNNVLNIYLLNFEIIDNEIVKLLLSENALIKNDWHIYDVHNNKMLKENILQLYFDKYYKNIWKYQNGDSIIFKKLLNVINEINKYQIYLHMLLLDYVEYLYDSYIEDMLEYYIEPANLHNYKSLLIEYIKKQGKYCDNFIMRTLIEDCHCSILYTDIYNDTPLSIYIQEMFDSNNNTSLIEFDTFYLLLNNKAIELPDCNEMYPIDHYIYIHYYDLDYDIAKLLLNEKIPKNYNSLSFAFAFIGNDVQLAELLIDENRLDDVDDRNDTFLHRYINNISHISPDIIKLLVTEENKKIKNKDGYIPLQYYYDMAHKGHGWPKYKMIYDERVIKLLL